MNVRSTPWGPVQQQEAIAPGLVSVSTSGHGGLCLSVDRWAAIIKAFPDFHGYAGDGFLEVDVDWAVAAIFWPGEFPVRWVHFAVKTVQDYQSSFTKKAGGWYFGTAREWLLSDAGAEARRIAGTYQEGGL